MPTIQRQLKELEDKRYGRYFVNLRVAKRRLKSVPVHIVILTAFSGPKPSPELEASHLNGNKKDNRPENLVWETKAENEARKREHGQIWFGELNARAKLTDAKVLEIRRLLGDGWTQESLARRFDVSQSNISDIARRRIWKHI